MLSPAQYEKTIKKLQQQVAHLSSLISSGGVGTNALTLNGHDSTYFTDVTNLTTGTLSNNLLNASVTKQGNTFNGTSQLVQTTAAGKLPAIDGSLLTNLPSSGSVITDNLTTSTTGTALDAHQGVILKGLLDSNTTSISSNTTNIGTNTTSITNLQTEVDAIETGAAIDPASMQWKVTVFTNY